MTLDILFKNDAFEKILTYLPTPDIVKISAVSKNSLEINALWKEIVSRFSIPASNTFKEGAIKYLNTPTKVNVYFCSNGPYMRSLEHISISCLPGTPLHSITAALQKLIRTPDKLPETCKVILDESGKLTDYRLAGSKKAPISIKYTVKGNDSSSTVENSYFSYKGYKLTHLVSNDTLTALLTPIRNGDTLSPIGPLGYFSLDCKNNDTSERQWKPVDELENFSLDNKLSDRTEIGTVAFPLIVVAKNTEHFSTYLPQDDPY